MIDGNFHPGRFAATSHAGHCDNLFPVNGQGRVPFDDAERDFLLLEGNERFDDVLSHDVSFL